MRWGSLSRSWASAAHGGRRTEEANMPADALKCKECATTYPLEARYVCERCFGPLEVASAVASGAA